MPAQARQPLDPSHALHPFLLLTGPLTTEREADAFWTLSATPLLGSFFSVPATLHKSTREKNTPQNWEMKPSYLGGKSP